MARINILIFNDRKEREITLEALLKGNEIPVYTTTSTNDVLKVSYENNFSDNLGVYSRSLINQ